MTFAPAASRPKRGTSVSPSPRSPLAPTLAWVMTLSVGVGVDGAPRSEPRAAVATTLELAVAVVVAAAAVAAWLGAVTSK